MEHARKHESAEFKIIWNENTDLFQGSVPAYVRFEVFTSVTIENAAF
jgi:hypothetical protein